MDSSSLRVYSSYNCLNGFIALSQISMYPEGSFSRMVLFSTMKAFRWLPTTCHFAAHVSVSRCPHAAVRRRAAYAQHFGHQGGDEVVVCGAVAVGASVLFRVYSRKGTRTCAGE